MDSNLLVLAMASNVVRHVVVVVTSYERSKHPNSFIAARSPVDRPPLDLVGH